MGTKNAIMLSAGGVIDGTGGPIRRDMILEITGGRIVGIGRAEADAAARNKEHEDFWLSTVHTIIHDTESGNNTELSLATAIDMLWPCHWNFTENLKIVLGAIGGDLYPGKPFAACGRNISSLPIRGRMEILSNTLKVFTAARNRIKKLMKRFSLYLANRMK